MAREYHCQTKNLVYLVHCKKCNDQYVGETEKTLEHRFSQHLGYVDNKDYRQATGRHFNLPGHNKSHMSITVLESINTDDPAYRKEREREFIEQFKLKYRGMNRKRWLCANCNENFFSHNQILKHLALLHVPLGLCSSPIKFCIYCNDHCLMRNLHKIRKY